MKTRKYSFTEIHFLMITLFLCFSYTSTVFGQDLENIGSKTLDKIKNSPLKISGAISANSVFYSANGRNSREPFTYFLQGNLNIGWLTFKMPLTYSFSNQGSNLGYQTPFKFNRVSLSPKYKWIQGHIGDIAMTFSPYTLSGHQFTGGGIELTPAGSFSISAMAGQLLKATEDDGQEQSVPAFKRMGYGGQLEWEKEVYKIGLIGFYAKDAINSISEVPEERNINPKENLVISMNGEITLGKNYTLSTEYASTAITQDLRSERSNEKGNGLASLLFNSRGATEYYDAFNASLDMNIDNMKVGIAYERIDPGYETLGAYYFNNDFENITLNASRPLFNDKLDLSFNIGYQRDNLANQKTQATSRIVGAVNATLKASDKITITGAYSNFSTHTNKSLNQFDDINDSDLTDEDLEALDYKQLSQNANITINWVLAAGENTSQNVNLNYNLASSANEQAGIIRVGQANNFHNANAVYTIGFPKKELNISTSINYNYSDIGRDDSDAIGGNIDVNKKFFDKKLNTTFGAAYNTNNSKDSKTDVLNFRMNASTLVAEKHNFNLNAVQVFKNTTAQEEVRELTVTFGYAYTFDLGKPKKKKKKTASPKKLIEELPVKEKKTKGFEFSYRTHSFKGTHNEISKKIAAIVQTNEFSTIRQLEPVVLRLKSLKKTIITSENGKNKVYKKAAMAYLRELYKNKDFLDTYHRLAIKSLKHLYSDAVQLDLIVKTDYLRVLAKVNTAKKNNNPVAKQDFESLQLKKKRYKAHKWMQEQLKLMTLQDVMMNKGLLNQFKNKELSTIFLMLNKGKSEQKVSQYLEMQFADFYHKKSVEIEGFELLD